MPRIAVLGALLLLTVLLLVGANPGSSVSLADDEYQRAVARVAQATALKQRHQSKGIDCAGCHGTELDFAVVPAMEVCLGCHESYEAVAARTAAVVPNPHHSHMGEVKCTDCHSEHKEPRLSCNQCHVFEMNVP